MEDTEGSVMVDGQTPDVQEDVQTEHVNKSEESSSEQEKDSESVKTETVAEDKTEDTEERKEEPNKVTDKGTRLDSDPLSQANQLRANAEAKARQMEDFLNDPKRVKAYLEDLEKENKTAIKEELIDPDNLETVDDLKRFAKQLQGQSKQELEAVKREVFGIRDGERIRETKNRISSEVKNVQEKYPVLREFNSDGTKNPEYNEELDTAIGEFYNELDYDAHTKSYRGQHSIAKIADRFMKVRGLGEKNGTVKAQTIIKDKRTGRIITNQQGDSNTASDESKQSASQTIAERMKRAALRTR